MKLNNRVLVAPVLAMALVLTACGSDSDESMDVDPTETNADGSADGGSADGGSTDSGSTDGGSADGGETDGGSADGGDTDGGSTDGGDTDGGTTDGGDTDSGADANAAGRVIVSAIESGFTSSFIHIVDAAAPFEVQAGLNPGVSDTIVRAYEDNYYVIRRYESDSITAFSVNDPSNPIYQLSTNSDAEPDVSSNPHDLVFLNANKAYLLRYGSPFVWIVNPSATDPSQFKIGEIDLSAYDADGVPDVARGVIVNDKLYIVMQRLESFVPTQTGYVAVIDTATDTEINTNTGELPGIELPAFNPTELSLDAATGTIFISAVGAYASFDGTRPAALTGGVVAVDTTDYSATALIDDTEGTGRFDHIAIATADKGYLVTTSDGVSSLDQFNPNTGRFDALGIAGLSGVDIRAIATGPAGNLWVGLADETSPKIVVVNPADNSLVSEGIPVTFNPSGFAFTQ